MRIETINSFEEFQQFFNEYNNVIVNVSAQWCRPCVLIKPKIEKFLSVINNENIIYLKIDNDVYSLDQRFENYFVIGSIPFFGVFKDNNGVFALSTGDFNVVSRKLFQFIKSINPSGEIENNINNENENETDLN